MFGPAMWQIFPVYFTSFPHLFDWRLVIAGWFGIRGEVQIISNPVSRASNLEVIDTLEDVSIK